MLIATNRKMCFLNVLRIQPGEVQLVQIFKIHMVLSSRMIHIIFVLYNKMYFIK